MFMLVSSICWLILIRLFIIRKFRMDRFLRREFWKWV